MSQKLRDHDKDRQWYDPCRWLAWLRDFRARKVAETPRDGQSFDRFLGTLQDDPRLRPMDRMTVSRDFFTSERYLEQGRRADWQQVELDAQRFAAAYIEAARRVSVPLFVHGAFRTVEEQKRLKLKGRSTLGGPRAPHCQGYAVDIVHSLYAWNLTDAEWTYLGALGKDVARRLGVRIRWGGSPEYGFYDPAHWELPGWETAGKLAIPSEAVLMSPRFMKRKLGL
jgi:hypothetical protein